MNTKICSNVLIVQPIKNEELTILWLQTVTNPVRTKYDPNTARVVRVYFQY